MISLADIQAIIDRILAKSSNEEDIRDLLYALLNNEEFRNQSDTLLIRGNKNVSQKGSGNINVGKAKDIQIGDRIYQQISVEAIQEALHDSVLKGLSEGFQGLLSSDFLGNYSIKPSINYRHLTGINEYPTLAFLEDNFPEKLKIILGIDTTPIIYTENNILDNIEKFTVESGNEFLISATFLEASIKYHINNDSYTKTGNYHVHELYKQEFMQSREDFEKDTLEYNREEKNFEFAPVTAKFHSDSDQGQWTSILEYEDTPGSGKILQYPKLSAVSSLGRKDAWIKKVIKINPDIRGLFLFSYSYIESLNMHFGMCGFDVEDLASCIPPSPYLRFVDIKNVQDKAIKIQSIDFNILEHDEYIITNVDNRQKLLESGHKLTQVLNIILSPQHHLLIPIEFGFDTKAHQQVFGGELAKLSPSVN